MQKYIDTTEKYSGMTLLERIDAAILRWDEIDWERDSQTEWQEG